MIYLGELDSQQQGKLFGTIVIVGAFVVYFVGRIIKSFSTSGTKPEKR